MVDCQKGDLPRGLPKSHLTTEGGECLYHCSSLDAFLEKGVKYYEYKDFPGLVPIIIVGSKLEMIECSGFSEPPKGIYKEVIRQISTELELESQASEHGGKENVTVFNDSIRRQLEPLGCSCEMFQTINSMVRELSNVYTTHLKLLQEPERSAPHKASGGWVVIRNFSDVPFYFRALVRLVRWTYMHAILAYAALTESDALMQVGEDNSRWLWVRSMAKDQDVLPSKAESGPASTSAYKFEKDGSYYKNHHPCLWALF